MWKINWRTCRSQPISTCWCSYKERKHSGYICYKLAFPCDKMLKNTRCQWPWSYSNNVCLMYLLRSNHLEKENFSMAESKIDNIKEKILQFSSSFLSNYSNDQSVSTLWDNFKSLCCDCLNLVPTKSISARNNHPWISPLIKCLSAAKLQQI